MTGAADTAAVPARPMPPASRIANTVPRILESPLLCVSTSNEVTACPARFSPLALNAKASFDAPVRPATNSGTTNLLRPQHLFRPVRNHRHYSPPLGKIDQELRREHGEVVHRLFIPLQRSTTSSW